MAPARAEIYVLTYAQNATPVHAPFLATLQTYCKARGATLIVLPGRYHNPTSHWGQAAMGQDWWAAEVLPYLNRGRFKIGQHLTVYGDISIQPTATHPLSEFEVFAGESSALFGHPKLALLTVPTAKRRFPRIFTTTGAVTRCNYTPSKAGMKAAAHHVFGAAVVERATDGMFHLRQINWDNKAGNFIDLDKVYHPDGQVTDAPPAAALVMGDIHVRKLDPEVVRATLPLLEREPGTSIWSILRPKALVIHDVLDFDVRSHHHRRDPRQMIDRRMSRDPSEDSVEAEVREVCAFLNACPIPPIVVRSNHDEAFERWLREAEPLRDDPFNAAFYFETWARLLRARLEDKRRWNPGEGWMPALELWYRAWAQPGATQAIFIGRDEALKIAGIHVHFHGDVGPNGSRGTRRNYAKLGVKTVIGHSHTPGIEDGCYQAGVTARLDHGYNNTPSAWLNTHVVIYANGKRCLITVINGKWRA